MQANEYQEWTRSTAVYPEDIALPYVALGLAGESGEVANKVKKVLRDSDGVLTDKRRDEIMDELGDVAWYFARAADELGTDLESLFDANRDKLEGRKSRGTLQGSGDTR